MSNEQEKIVEIDLILYRGEVRFKVLFKKNSRMKILIIFIIQGFPAVSCINIEFFQRE